MTSKFKVTLNYLGRMIVLTFLSGELHFPELKLEINDILLEVYATGSTPEKLIGSGMGASFVNMIPWLRQILGAGYKLGSYVHEVSLYKYSRFSMM